MTCDLFHNPMNLAAFRINYKVGFSFPTCPKLIIDVKQVTKSAGEVLCHSVLNFPYAPAIDYSSYRTLRETMRTPYPTPQVTLVTSVRIKLTRGIL